MSTSRGVSEVRGLLDEVGDQVRSAYGERLRGVFLFGSYARGEADSESDVDVLVVLDAVPGYGREVDATDEFAANTSLRHGASLSLVFVPEDDWIRGESSSSD